MIFNEVSSQSEDGFQIGRFEALQSLCKAIHQAWEAFFDTPLPLSQLAAEHPGEEETATAVSFKCIEASLSQACSKLVPSSQLCTVDRSTACRYEFWKPARRGLKCEREVASLARAAQKRIRKHCETVADWSEEPKATWKASTSQGLCRELWRTASGLP